MIDYLQLEAEAAQRETEALLNAEAEAAQREAEARAS